MGQMAMSPPSGYGLTSIEESDIIKLDELMESNPTISDCIKDGRFETVKELCKLEGIEIIFTKKENMNKRFVIMNEDLSGHY